LARWISCYEKRNKEMTGGNWSIQCPTIRSDDGLHREREIIYKRFYVNAHLV